MSDAQSLASVGSAAAGSAVSVRPATADDVAPLVVLINDAYEVETGDSGVAFKKTKRIVHNDEVGRPIAEGRVFVAATAAGEVLGTIFYELYESRPAIIGFGPFAVSPAAQGKGVGRALLAAVEAEGHRRGCTAIQLETVHHRTDLEPIYRRMGFVPIGEEPFTHVERITRPCHFIIWRRRLAPAPCSEAEAQAMPHILEVLNAAREAVLAVAPVAGADGSCGAASSGAGASPSSPASGTSASAAAPSLRLRLRMGRPDDSDEAEVTRIVNEAYAIEEGSAGVAFKREGCKRLHGDKGRAEARAWLAAGRVVVAEGCLSPAAAAAPSAASAAPTASSSVLSVLGVLVFGEGDIADPRAEEPQPLARITGAIKGIHFGPFAVDAGAQRRGVGAALLEAVEAHARARALPLQIEVVDTRSDVLPMYAGRGYAEVGTLAWAALADPSMLTRDVHFKLLRRQWA